MVNDVAEKDGVHALGGEFRVVRAGLNGLDLGVAGFGDHLEQLGVEVDGEDLSGVTREAAGEITAACTDVGDGFVGAELEGGQNFVRLLPGVALGVFEDFGVFGGVAWRMMLMLFLRPGDGTKNWKTGGERRSRFHGYQFS